MSTEEVKEAIANYEVIVYSWYTVKMDVDHTCACCHASINAERPRDQAPDMRHIVYAPCKHMYHQFCITDEFEKNGTKHCPRCYRNLPPSIQEGVKSRDMFRFKMVKRLEGGVAEVTLEQHASITQNAVERDPEYLKKVVEAQAKEHYWENLEQDTLKKMNDLRI